MKKIIWSEIDSHHAPDLYCGSIQPLDQHGSAGQWGIARQGRASEFQNI